jgi:FixJ family two-component response regulator
MSGDAERRVFVVDDDASARRGILRLLASARFAAEGFGSAAEFLARAPYPGSCCLVLDYQMPEMSGLELQSRLRERGLRVPIVFVTGHGDVPASVRAMKDGAVDFLLKPFTAEELLTAVELALEKGRVGAAEEAERSALRQRWETLTPREKEVLELVVAGLLNKQTAGRLGTVEKTVKAHRARIMQKMAAGSLADLVRMAAKLGPAASPGDAPNESKTKVH